MAEQIILDPSEVAVNRTELNVHSGALRVKEEGIDWGEAAIEATMAKLTRGEVPVDFRVPNREVRIPLTVLKSGATTLATARHNLEAKAALFQREGGWLKRQLTDGSKLYLDIVNARLKLGGGTHQAQHDVDPDGELTIEAIPDFYGDEIALADHIETTLPELVFTEATVKGTYPGRVRIVVDEDQGQDQLGLVWGIRSRYYSAASTARLAYEAEALTPLDTAATATLTGSSGGSVMKHTNLASSWTPVLKTDILSGSAYMTHQGTYRVLARVYSTSPDQDVDVKLRFIWDVGDLTLPVENDPWTFPGASNFYLADLGEVRLDAGPVGPHRWQGQIQAKGTNGGEQVQIDRLYLVPVDDGYGTCRGPLPTTQGSNTYSARDEFNQTAGNLNGKTLPVGGTWATSGDATDLAVETTGKTAQRASTSDTNGRFAIAGLTTFSLVAVQQDVKVSALPTSIIRTSLLVRYVDVNNYVRISLQLSNSGPVVSIVKVVAGSSYYFPTRPLSTLAPAVFYTTLVLVNQAGLCVAWVYPQGGRPNAVPSAIGQHADLATGGALASGKVGFFDWTNSAAVITRNYDNFAAWVPDKDAAIFASRSAQLRTDGHIRQDSTGTAYGPESFVTGSQPRLAPSSLEARTLEFFLKASRGDLDQLPDLGIDDISARAYYRPSWLFVPEL